MADLPQSRPFGEYFVDIQRPPQRFGQSITFAIRGEDNQYWVAKILEGGELLYEPHSPATVVIPTLYVNDMEQTALVRALNQLPKYPENVTEAHLHDVIGTRDALLTLVEHMREDHHTLAMKALEA